MIVREKIVSIYGEIEKWAKSQDSLVKEVYLKVISQNGYSNDDVISLATLLKIDEKVVERNTESPHYSTFPDVLTEIFVENNKIILKRIQNTKNVTTIKDLTVAPFSHEGITVIYGENGAGKSGIARILKQACRARKVDKVLSNVFVNDLSVPTGDIVIQTKEIEKIIPWQDGKYSIDELSNISVFDSKCALVQIDGKNQLFFAPKGSEIFQHIVNCLNSVRDEISKEKKQLKLPTLSKQYQLNSELFKFVSNIDKISKSEDLSKKIAWNESDENLLKQQLELKTATNEEINRKKQASLQQKLIKITTIEDYLNKAEQVFSEEKVKSFLSLSIELESKQKALDILSKTLSTQSQLPDVGGPIWRELYLAAKKYSEEVAYIDKKYPNIENDSVCVLCQQELQPIATERMKSFEKVMEGVIKRDFDTAVTSRNKAIKYLSDNFTDKQSSIQDIYKDLKIEHPELPDDESIAISGLCEQILSAAPDDDGITLLFKSQLLSPVQGLRKTVNSSIEELKEILKPEKLKDITDKLQETEYKKEIFNNKDKYIEYVNDANLNKKIESCLKKLSTASISKAGSKIISTHINKLFLDKLNEELSSLRAKKIPLTIKMSGDAGSVLFDVELENAKIPKATKLSEILSEGEVKVISLAVFLAEVGIQTDKYPIVLDDPVTSLDHKYREKIAERLVIAGTDRQVVIFTHDISFVTMIEKNCLEKQIPMHLISIKKDAEHSEILETSPWNAKGVADRVVFLRELTAQLKKVETQLDQETYNRRAGEIYGFFRETWERFVEEILFYKAISRFGYEVKTLSLKGVMVTDDDFKTIFWGMSKCSRWMVGHDDSEPLDSSRPKTEEIEKDIETFAAYVKISKKRNNDLNTARENLVKTTPTSPVG